MEYQNKLYIQSLAEDTNEVVEEALDELGLKGYRVTTSVLVGDYIYHYLTRPNP